MSVICLQPATRRIHCPPWALIAGAAWLALVGAAVYFAPRAEDAPALCTFKRLTGVPCPTCGTTRMTMALSRGDVASALALNPLMATLFAASLVWLILRLGCGRTITLATTKRQRRMLWLAAAIMLCANWVYLILAGR